MNFLKNYFCTRLQINIFVFCGVNKKEKKSKEKYLILFIIILSNIKILLFFPTTKGGLIC